jgi:hypothetical protein
VLPALEAEIEAAGLDLALGHTDAREALEHGAEEAGRRGLALLARRARTLSASAGRPGAAAGAS